MAVELIVNYYLRFYLISFDQLITGPRSIEPTLKSNNTDNLNDLMKVIMEALDSAKLTGDSIYPHQEQVESLVMELSPEKRKVLNEILGLVVNQPEGNFYHRPQNLQKPLVSKQIEVFTLPPGRSINIHVIHIFSYLDYMTDFMHMVISLL